MKKLLLLVISASLLSSAASAQATEASLKKETEAKNKAAREAKRKLNDAEINVQTSDAFYKDFGNIPVIKWVRTPEFDQAYFNNKHGQRTIAYYDATSTLVGTTTKKTFADLPVKAQEYINKKYPGYTKGPVVFFRDNDDNDADMIYYEQPFEDSDNYFIELSNGTETIVQQVTPDGEVAFFKKLK